MVVSFLFCYFTEVIIKTPKQMRTIEQNDKYEVIGLSQSELTEVLKGIEKGTFGYFEIRTNVRMNKTGNPYHDQVTKITKGNVYIGGKVDEDDEMVSHYQKRVINKTGNEDFTPEQNKVGEHIEGTCVIFNERLNRYYLQYEWFNEVKPKSTFEFEGNEIEKQMFQDFMRPYTPNKYGVNIQSVMIQNIKEIHLNHVHYVVENEVLV